METHTIDQPPVGLIGRRVLVLLPCGQVHKSKCKSLVVLNQWVQILVWAKTESPNTRWLDIGVPIEEFRCPKLTFLSQILRCANNFILSNEVQVLLPCGHCHPMHPNPRAHEEVQEFRCPQPISQNPELI